MVDIIHIHEDDRGMRNLYPIAARVEAENDIAAAAAAAERNRYPSGFGYADIYITKPPSTDYTEVGLAVSDVEEALTSFLPRMRVFNATIFSAMRNDERDPFGSYDDDALCFGLGPHCYIKFEIEGPLVRSIWFDLNTNDAADFQLFRSAIHAIDALASSIIVDYFLNFTGIVSEPSVLSEYLVALKGG
jgi:hypothetical protein